jgi:hypothetical protein
VSSPELPCCTHEACRTAHHPEVTSSTASELFNASMNYCQRFTMPLSGFYSSSGRSSGASTAVYTAEYMYCTCKYKTLPHTQPNHQLNTFILREYFHKHKCFGTSLQGGRAVLSKNTCSENPVNTTTRRSAARSKPFCAVYSLRMY